MATTLDDVRIIDELLRRPASPRDLRAENEAFLVIARTFSTEPSALLHALTAAAMRLCGAGSCGVSLLEGEPDTATEFRWVALSGALASYEGGTTPSRFSPCGVSLSEGAPGLFRYPARYYPYFHDASPEIVECLVMPFSRENEVHGTIWVVAHDELTRFTQSHVDVMSALADFTVAALAVLKQESRARALAESESAARRDAEEANRLKDLFLATVSHELRTPLNSMLGWSELLAAGGLAAADAALAVRIIHRNALRQSRLVEDLLDVSREYPDDVPEAWTHVEIQDAVRRAADAVRPAAAAAAVRLEVNAGSCSAFVMGDADRLQQLIGNLMANAVKFTPSGGEIRVEVDIGVSDVTVLVADNGIGIAPEFLARVFERFAQSDTSTTRRHPGLGLGLTIARRIALQHNGTLTASSGGIGQGACFTLVLPRAADAAQPLVPRVMPASDARRADLGDIRVLVVDDEPDTREAIAMMLTHHGAIVCTAGSVREALDVCVESSLDVLLADIALPDQDGYALVEQVRAGGRIQSRHLGVAALTARTSAAEQARALASGFDLHLRKPVEASTLVAAVAELARLGRGRRERHNDVLQ